MRSTFTDGLGMVRRSPELLTILSIGLIYGLYSEGFDRLWTKHILDQFTLPLSGILQPVFWFGLIRAVGLLLSTGATELLLRKVDTASFLSIARMLKLITVFLIGGTIRVCTRARFSCCGSGVYPHLHNPESHRTGLYALGQSGARIAWSERQ